MAANERMDPAGGPVIENRDAPAMDVEGDVMGVSPLEPAGPRMSEPAPQAPLEDDAEYPPMQPRGQATTEGGAAAFAASEQGEGYLRLVIEVNHGELSVADAAVIDGPLAQTDLTGEMAYEAQVHGRRVAADSFDDLSVQHGFAPPDDPSRGHSVTRRNRFQFVARIPRSAVTADELGDLEIALMRPARTTQLAELSSARSAESLTDVATGAGEEPPEIIGRLRGVDLEALPTERAEAVHRALR